MNNRKNYLCLKKRTQINYLPHEWKKNNPELVVRESCWLPYFIISQINTLFKTVCESHKQITAHPLPVELKRSERRISEKGKILETTPFGFISHRYVRGSFGLSCIAFPWEPQTFCCPQEPGGCSPACSPGDPRHLSRRLAGWASQVAPWHDGEAKWWLLVPLTVVAA